MRRIIYAIILFFICFFLLQSNLIEIRETSYKSIQNEKIYEEKIVNDDSIIIKNLLTKILESQINESNFINKHFINKTLDQVSKQLAIYYNQIMNFTDDPERSIKIVNDIINNSQVYIEAGSMYLHQMTKDLTKEYDEIKNKYCTNFFEKFVDNQSWREKATLNEIEKITELELQLEEINNVLSVLNRIRMLFNAIDWTIYSTSPFAWLVRRYIGW